MSSLEDLTPEARDELAQLARELADNPSTREDFLRLTKKARPSLTIDAIDIKDEVAARLEQANERVNALEGKLREKEALDTLERRRRDLDRAVTSKAQIRLVLETFRDRLFTEIFPGRSVVPKTLIFAKDDNHAEAIVGILREDRRSERPWRGLRMHRRHQAKAKAHQAAREKENRRNTGASGEPHR